MKKVQSLVLSVAKRSPARLANILVDFAFPRKLKHIVMDLGSVCNANCPFCARFGKKGPIGVMNKDVFEVLFKQIEEIKSIKWISLYAFGEPLLNPNAGKFIERLSVLGRKLLLSTNTTNLDKFSDSLMNLDVLQFSIEGHDKESYEKNRKNLRFEDTLGRLSEFDKVVKERRSKGLKTPFRQIHSLVTKKSKLKEFINLWSPYVDQVKFSILGPHIMWNEKREAEFLYPEGMREECFDFSYRSNMYDCEYVARSITINAEGKAVLCCSDFEQLMNFGDYRDIKAVFNHPVYKDLHRKMVLGHQNLCDRCRVFWTYSKDDVFRELPEFLELSDYAKKSGVKVVFSGD